MSLIEESSYVRIWLDKGKEQGRIEGEQKGKIEGEQKGRIEGEQKGRIEGEQKGRIEGEQKGRIEGVQKGKIEGKIEGERAIIVRLGRKRFGEPDAATLAKLDSIQSIERLDEISDRLITAANWNEAIGD